MFNRILVAIDGSDGSEKALASSRKLADHSQAELLLVTVAEPISSMPYEVGVYSSAFLRENNFEKNKDYSQQIIDNAKGYVPSSVSARAKLLQGDPAKEICEYGKNQQVDLIVIGNRGLSGIKKWLQGSVSKKVSMDAECSVLVVK